MPTMRGRRVRGKVSVILTPPSKNQGVAGRQAISVPHEANRIEAYRSEPQNVRSSGECKVIRRGVFSANRAYGESEPSGQSISFHSQRGVTTPTWPDQTLATNLSWTTSISSSG